MDIWDLFLLLLLLATSLVPSLGTLTKLSITLFPRNYTDPRSVDNFTCGFDPGVDADRLLAEANTAYLFNVIDNTEDVDEFYRTEVFDVISFSQSGEPKQITNENKFNGKTGLFTLFLVPSRLQCNVLTFKDGVSAGRGYYPVFIGFTNVLHETTILDRFKTDAQVFRNHYLPRNELPKLCGSFTPMLSMSSDVAVLRTKSLTQVFNFLYNEDRDAGSFKPSPSTNCRTTIETEQSLATIMTSDGIHFENTEHLANESNSFVKINLIRRETTKKGVVFIETVDQTADETDFVKYKGPVVFSEGSNTASYLMRIKCDMETTNETFSLKIVKRHKRMKRANDVIRVINPPKTRKIFQPSLLGFSKLQDTRKNPPVYEFPLTKTHNYVLNAIQNSGTLSTFYDENVRRYINRAGDANRIDPESTHDAAIRMMGNLLEAYRGNENHKVASQNIFEELLTCLKKDLTPMVKAWANEQVGEKFGADRKLDIEGNSVPWEEADAHEIQMEIYNRGLTIGETVGFPQKFYQTNFAERMNSKHIKSKHKPFQQFLNELEAEGQSMPPFATKKRKTTMAPYFDTDTENFANSGVMKRCKGDSGEYQCRIWIDKAVWDNTVWEEGYLNTLKVFFLNEPLRVTPTEGKGVKPRPIKLAHPDGSLKRKHTHGPFMVAGRSKNRLAATFVGDEMSHELNAQNHLKKEGQAIINTNKNLSLAKQKGITNDNLYERSPKAFYFNEVIREHQ